MTYFPIHLELKGRPCLVIGGGAVAERKIAHLLEAGAAVTVISPKVTAAIAGSRKRRALTLRARKYRPGDLAGFQIVFVATDDRETNQAVHGEGKSRGVWVNVADDPAHCDFILPSVLRRGELTVAVSSGGASPALARAIREELELYFTREYESLAHLAAEVRKELRRRSITVSYKDWRQALSGDARRLLRRGKTTRAKHRLLKDLGVPQ